VILISLCKKVRDQRSYLSATRHSLLAIRYLQFAIPYSLLALSFSAAAQSILAPAPPGVSGSGQAPRITGTSQLAPVAPGFPTAGLNEALVDWGGAHLHPHFVYRFSYGDGLQAQPGEPSKTIIHEVSPGLLIQLGTHWTLDYTPTIRSYSSSRFHDGVDHSVSMSGNFSSEEWTFGISQGYGWSSAPLVETASQTDQETFSTALSAGYQVNSKISLSFGVNQSLRFLGQSAQSEALSDSRDWSTMEWVNYQIWPRLSFSLGAGGGYTDVQIGTDMAFEQLQSRIHFVPGTKLDLSINAGFEDRQLLDSGLPDLINPIFGLSVQYHLFDPTTFSLAASRAVSASYFQHQVTETTGFSASVQQRLLQQLYLSLSGGYGTSDYVTTQAGTDVNRSDTYVSFSASLSMSFLKRASASIFYSVSDNTSRESNFSYSNTQIGAELGYRF
jgi:hypothetical protein